MQLRETTLDPNTRRLVQLVISDEDEQQTTAMMDIFYVWRSVRSYTSRSAISPFSCSQLRRSSERFLATLKVSAR
jgi:hypothetical protein